VLDKEFAIGRMARDRILAWPARVAGIVSMDALAVLQAEAELLCIELRDQCARIAEEVGF